MLKVVIVGGVAGGASAAARIRRLDENAKITMFERSGFVSYANCGLPYYIGGVITDDEELTLQTPESFYKRFRIDAKVKHEVTKINRGKKTVTVKNLVTGEEFEEAYDKLILSPGAKSTIPNIEGIDGENVFSLRTVEDTMRIRQYVTERRPKTAVIAGGGFIGLEMAENLIDMGVEVTIVQRPTQVMPPLDQDMASMLHSELMNRGAKLSLGSTVVAIKDEGNAVITVLKTGEELKSDFVILAIGVTPDTYLAKNAGLELGLKGSIVVNDKMETADPDIYAVGDAVQVKHMVTGLDAVISLAGPANKQGRIAADNVCGGNSTYKGSLGSSVIKLFDITAAATGLNEKTAKAAGIEYDKVVLSPLDHAGYYPGATMLTMKVLFEKNTGKIIGGQIVGYSGVDKRIDVIATAIYGNMTAYQLKELDLAYAPPYSSAKDPVNMAGFMIENILEGRVKQFHYEDLPCLDRDKVTLLDTRTPFEFAGGNAPGFKNIPVDELRERLDELDKSKPVYVMCQSGLRSYISCRILSQHGFECYNFSGGYRFYNIIEKGTVGSKSAYPCGLEK